MSIFGELQEATESWLKCKWGRKAPGAGFRCGLCPHKFVLGDLWRCVMANIPNSPTRHGNFLVCQECHDKVNGEDAELLKQRAKLEDEVDALADLGLYAQIPEGWRE